MDNEGYRSRTDRVRAHTDFLRSVLPLLAPPVDPDDAWKGHVGPSLSAEVIHAADAAITAAFDEVRLIADEFSDEDDVDERDDADDDGAVDVHVSVGSAAEVRTGA